MPKRFLFFLIPVFLACANSPPGAGPPVPGSGFGDSGRFQDGLIFFGVSGGHYVSRSAAVSAALKDAARRLSFYHSVEAVIQFDETYNRQFQGTQTDSAGTLIYDEDYEKYIDALEFNPEADIFEEDGLLFVRAGYEDGDSISPDHIRSPADRTNRTKKPGWIENQPAAVDGRPAAVGFAGPRLSYKNAVTASYENAVFALVQNYFYAAAASQIVHNETMDDSSFTRAAGIVTGFYVLETWTDPDTGGVWTLATAREITNSRAGGE
ncbi:MAG: hypothetical protein LBH70_06445 [Spirochaetaceae bacterium]|jgi:hypothetical protein|nr:hypothetical protein [Spirochaetaceae bacterium]